MQSLFTLIFLALTATFAVASPVASVTNESQTRTVTAPAPLASTCANARKFTYFGVNQSGAEFGQGKIPGVKGTDYIWPAPSSIDYFVNQGFNFFRVPFQLERLTPPSIGITGAFDNTYFTDLQSTVNYITNKGATVAIEPHNFLIYNGATMSDTSQFQTFWRNLASKFANNNKVIFDLMNEPHDVPATQVAAMMQAGINGVRSAGATSQLILVEGTSWTGAWRSLHFLESSTSANLLPEMHQYLDSDGSGTSPNCVSSTIGAERLADATNWLKQHNLRGFLGEIGVGSNPTCISALFGALCSMAQSGSWIGASYWAAGPWWGTVRTCLFLTVIKLIVEIFVVLPEHRAPKWRLGFTGLAPSTQTIPVISLMYK
ncbi:glycoside hydrolase family 5 protein [Moniliophthora roreri]|nr:glycoside hydrolase family 5 protein [Moniliophthora roreri]